MIEEKDKPDSSEENFFDKMAEAPSAVQVKKLQRSKSNVVIGGVCSGIANYLGKDVSTIRLIALLTLLFGGLSVVVYLIMAVLMPYEIVLRPISKEEKILQRRENFKTVFGGLLMLIGLHYSLSYFGISVTFPHGVVFPISIVAIALGIFFLSNNSSINDIAAVNQPEKFYRSRTNRKLMGVCGGLGEYLGVDSSSLRIIFLVSTFLTLGLFAALYLLIGLNASLETERQSE